VPAGEILFQGARLGLPFSEAALVLADYLGEDLLAQDRIRAAAAEVLEGKLDEEGMGRCHGVRLQSVSVCTATLPAERRLCLFLFGGGFAALGTILLQPGEQFPEVGTPS
jgi:hypothetical protein